MKRGAAPAKINLALVVGPRRADGRHELVTLYQRVALSDHLAVSAAPALRVDGFAEDRLVRRALESVADGNGSFAAQIRKRMRVGLDRARRGCPVVMPEAARRLTRLSSGMPGPRGRFAA